MTQQMWTSPGTEPLIDRLRRAVIGRYDVYAELGQGGMASVFLALDLALDRKVAIKVMSPALMSSPDNLERFRREAKVAAALNHPHIIGILAVGDDPELAYFVMKFIEGRALDSVIREEGPQSVPFTQSVIASAGRALHYAHTRGVIHRDVKPANFMLDQDGWLVVTDFGIAKQGDVKGLTVTGSLIGTPYYMSPEQFHGKPVTAHADQYALGIVAFELLTGRQPYTGDTVAEVMRGHLFDDLVHVRDLRPEIPAEVDACIARMMAKEPEERFPTLEDAVVAFGHISATQEQQVRTQIIELAKVGANLQPQIKVPLSPVPVQRTRPEVTRPSTSHPGAPTTPSGAGPMDATTPIPRQRTEPPVPRTREVAAPAAERAPRSKMPLIAALLVLGGAAGATAVLKPELFRGSGSASTTETVDSTAIRDSIARAQQSARDAEAQRAAAAAAERTRIDSIARADSLSRVAQSSRDSVSRADSLLRAAAARRLAARRAATTPQRTAPAPGPLRSLKDGRRGRVPPRNP